MPTFRQSITAETKEPTQPARAETDLAIDHPTLAVVVAERLRKLIASGELPPGARLNERSLCDRLRVSRTPLREAYRILASEGLIEVLPKRGARVIEMSAADIADVFDLLAVVEGLSGRLAAEKASRATLEDVAALHRQMAAAYEARDMVRYSVVSKAVHVAINAAAGSAPLKDIYLRLNGQVQRLRYKSNLEGDNWARSVEAHARFVAALLARDGALAERLLREHLLDKKAFAQAHPAADSD